MLIPSLLSKPEKVGCGRVVETTTQLPEECCLIILLALLLSLLSSSLSGFVFEQYRAQVRPGFRLGHLDMIAKQIAVVIDILCLLRLTPSPRGTSCAINTNVKTGKLPKKCRREWILVLRNHGMGHLYLCCAYLKLQDCRGSFASVVFPVVLISQSA